MSLKPEKEKVKKWAFLTLSYFSKFFVWGWVSFIQILFSQFSLLKLVFRNGDADVVYLV